MEDLTKQKNELGSPHKLFNFNIPDEVFRIVRVIFNFITGGYLKISIILLIVFLFYRQWNIIIPISINIVLIYLIKIFGKWFVKNYQNIKVTTIKEGTQDTSGVYEIQLDKEADN